MICTSGRYVFFFSMEPKMHLYYDFTTQDRVVTASFPFCSRVEEVAVCSTVGNPCTAVDIGLLQWMISYTLYICYQKSESPVINELKKLGAFTTLHYRPPTTVE